MPVKPIAVERVRTACEAGCSRSGRSCSPRGAVVDDRGGAERPVGAHPVDGVVADRHVEDAPHELAVHEVAGRELDAVGVRLRAVVEVVDVAVLDGDVLADVEAVLAAVDVERRSGDVGLADRGPAGVLAVDLGVLKQQRRAAVAPSKLTTASRRRRRSSSCGSRPPAPSPGCTRSSCRRSRVFGVEIVDGPV